MAQNPHKQDVTAARQSLEALITKDQTLRGDYSNIQESEYKALIQALQNRDIELTPEEHEGAGILIDQLRDANQIPQSVADRAKLALNETQGE